MRPVYLAVVSLCLFLGGVSDGCAATFPSGSLIQTVRILAVRADPPYAAPSATVNLDVLAFDGRPVKPEPMVISWLPQPCFNPRADNYYACFASFKEAFHAGVDLTGQLIAAPKFSFQMPMDILTSHPNASGEAPYGLAVVFAVACAGHVEYTPSANGAPDAVPFGCFDTAGANLGPDAFVFSYTLVYSFGDRTNANPVIDGITYAGTLVDADAGITAPHCTQADVDDCPTTPLDTIVPASSQEADPAASTDGTARKEQIYVDYYLTAGKVKNDTVILYDSLTGQLSGTADNLYAPQEAGDARLWAVVHDNRGGVTWQDVTLHAQ